MSPSAAVRAGRYSCDWKPDDLTWVPDRPNTRSGCAQQVNHRLRQPAGRGIGNRSAVGLDGPAVHLIGTAAVEAGPPAGVIGLAGAIGVLVAQHAAVARVGAAMAGRSAAVLIARLEIGRIAHRTLRRRLD